MQKIVTRLKRLNGQINGLIKMIEEKQDCDKIIIQFLATKAALDSAFTETLNSNLQQCLKKKDNKNMTKILKLITKKS